MPGKFGKVKRKNLNELLRTCRRQKWLQQDMVAEHQERGDGGSTSDREGEFR